VDLSQSLPLPGEALHLLSALDLRDRGGELRDLAPEVSPVRYDQPNSTASTYSAKKRIPHPRTTLWRLTGRRANRAQKQQCVRKPEVLDLLGRRERGVLPGACPCEGWRSWRGEEYSGDGRSRSFASTADRVSAQQVDLRTVSLGHLLKPLLEGCPG
jgi:hypothetical protein